MRALFYIFLPMLLAAAVGMTVCIGLGGDPHVKLLVAAAIATLLGASLALVPKFFARGGTQQAVMQAALIGTSVHLFACIIVAAVASFSIKPGIAFTYWLLAFYWTTLLGVAIVYVKAVRRAPTGAPLGPRAS